MGEGGWSAFEIVIVLVLAIALLGRIFGTDVPGKTKIPEVANYSEKTQEKKSTAPTITDCWSIAVTKPTPSQKITATTGSIMLEGSMRLCDTIPTTPDTFSVTVVDARAKVVAGPVTIPTTITKDHVVFSTNIPLTVVPDAGTGYVIITRFSNSGAQVTDNGARVPVRFVK